MVRKKTRKRGRNLNTRVYRKARRPKRKPQVPEPQSINPLRLNLDIEDSSVGKIEMQWSQLRDDQRIIPTVNVIPAYLTALFGADYVTNRIVSLDKQELEKSVD